MNKLISIFFCFLLFSTGCSTTRSVNTDSIKKFTKDLKGLSPTIEKVQFTFTRPNLYCRIDMNKELGKEELESILTEIKEFSTIDNINEIASSVKWGLEISNIYLDINSDKDHKTIEHAYYAKYFKTSDASDYSETNIESYKIWYERTEKISER